MPKFQSKRHTVKFIDNEGKEQTKVKNVWIPIDDAAKITDLADEAEALGAYKRSDPGEKEKIKTRLKKAMHEDLVKKGFIDKDATLR